MAKKEKQEKKVVKLKVLKPFGYFAGFVSEGDVIEIDGEKHKELIEALIKMGYVKKTK